jgi:hypothetical protein
VENLETLLGCSHLIKQSVHILVDFAPSAEENKLVAGNKWGRRGFMK